jgi:hypothetical protein
VDAASDFGDFSCNRVKCSSTYQAKASSTRWRAACRLDV